jgi:Flp pilus assembly protein TadG
MAEGILSRLVVRARLTPKCVRADQSGGVAMTFGLLFPVLLLVSGVVVDYTGFLATRSMLKDAADASALAAAREFRLGNANTKTLAQVATSNAQDYLALQDLTATVTTSVDLTNRAVSVKLSTVAPTMVLKFVEFATRIEVVSTARMVGGAPICVIGLNTSSNHTVELDKYAQLSAGGCSVYSNSKKPSGLVARDFATIEAAFICSAGGKLKLGKGEFSPAPQSDCPVMADPLASRNLPDASGCLKTKANYKGGTVQLVPGTYCAGVTIDKGAKVVLAPGIYVFKDGPLVVKGGSSLKGTNVALHFVGKNAELDLQTDSQISITAPKSGMMAGILISEDRNNSTNLVHRINSNDAPTLLGTIYLPRGTLYVGAQAPVAEESAYTIVVANRFRLSEGPTIVLNTNYDETDVPVPDGVGSLSGKTFLSE